MQKICFHIQHFAFRKQIYVARPFLHPSVPIRNFSNDNNKEKPILLVGQHDVAIIQEGKENNKERIRDQSIQYKLRDKVLYFNFVDLIYVFKDFCIL